jgi:hypothetical protein
MDGRIHMSKGEVWRRNEIARRSNRFRCRRVLLTLTATLVAALPGSILIASQPAFGAGNANLVGRWKISGGYLGVTVKSENRTTGACAGVTASSQYHMIGCRVTGNKYVFTITLGNSYRSRNVGTISGNEIIGSFRDTNGTVVQYTGVR